MVPILCPQGAGVDRRPARWTSMNRHLFRSLSGQQAQPSEERTMGACRRKPSLQKPGGQARLFLQMKALTPVSASTDTAVPGKSAAVTARPAGAAPWLASVDLSPAAVGKGQYGWPYQRGIVRLSPNPSRPFAEGLVLATGRSASTTTNEDNAPAD